MRLGLSKIIDCPGATRRTSPEKPTDVSLISFLNPSDIAIAINITTILIATEAQAIELLRVLNLPEPPLFPLIFLAI